MIFVRMACAYGIMFSLSLFVSSNINDILFGSGYVFLLFAGLLFGTLTLLSNDLDKFARPTRSSLFLVVFFTYFAIKYYLESQVEDEFKQVTIGTSGGIVFSFGIGFISSCALATIYELRSHRTAHSLSMLAGAGYLLFVLGISWGALQEHLGGVRSDLFLIEDQEGFYQRVGNLVFVQIMLMASLSTVLLTTSHKISLLKSLPYHLLILLSATVFGITAQLVGSNSGLVATTAFVFVYMVNFFVMRMAAKRDQEVSITTILSGPYIARIIFSSAFTAVVIAAVGIFALDSLGINPDMLRISGFGSGEISSVESRATLFKENFLVHFFYSPLFGNTQVDKLTTGSGTYAHSLLALLPHLGLVGFTIFLAAVSFTYLDIADSSHGQFNSIGASRSYGLFRQMALGAVLAMALYSSFYTWMPLWFAWGLFGKWFYERESA